MNGHVYTPGDIITFRGGPQDGVEHILTGSDIERGYIPAIIPSAAPRHPADPKDGVSKTPIFDRALGMPTPEPGVGSYTPSNANHAWHWYWHPQPGRRYAIAKTSDLA